MLSCGQWSRFTGLFGLIAFYCLSSAAHALDRTWIGVGENWVDGGATANWTPADEPDSDDRAIFNTNNAVNLGSNNEVNGLALSGGIDLMTNDFDLTVNGLVELVDSSTYLVVAGEDSLLAADSVTVNNLAHLQLTGGTVQINEESGNGLLDINAGGELLGFGTISMTDAVAASTTLIVNDGQIAAQRSPAIILAPPVVGTLTIGATDADARIDLDGAGEGGEVIVRRNQILDINMQLADIFNGSISMFHETKLDISTAWTLGAGGVIDIDNGEGLGIPTIPAGTSTISGGALTQTGGTINVLDPDGTLRFDTEFTMNAGTFNNQGHVIFGSDATINVGGTFNMGASGSDLTVDAGAAVLINQISFNLDGNGPGTIITVNENGILNLNLGDYDNDAVTNSFDATIMLNSGTLTVTSSDAEFVMDGTLTMNNTAGVNPNWNGEPIDIGNDSGVLDADLNIIGTGNSDFWNSVDFNSDADVNIATGARLRFLSNSTVDFNAVNGGNNAEFTGAGSIEFNGAVNVNEDVTLDMTGGTVDLDGQDALGNTINIDAPFTINAQTLDSFGRSNSSGTNTLDINNSVGSGVLTVNLDDPNAEWTLNAEGVMNLVNDNTAATLLGGNDVNINGTVNVTGDVRSTARLDITGTVNINTAGQPLRLAGGNNLDRPNTITGGTINGLGVLGADTDKELRGYGTINADIDFDGTGALWAEGGDLVINADGISLGILGAEDGAALVTNTDWSTGGVITVILAGGELRGAGTITTENFAGIQGYGVVSSRIINNSQLIGGIGPPGTSLLVQTVNNDNDWDGVNNLGQLAATAGGTLELRDTGPAFGFAGSVNVGSDSRVFTNGFALDFNPGSSIVLINGTYESTSSTDIGGTVTVGGLSTSTIKVKKNFFLTFESGSNTTLNSNLRLENNNITIEQGAVFNGTGALVIPDGSHMVGENLADIGVLVDMQGAFRPGNSQGIGRVNLFDFQQSSTSELYIELTGAALNAFDRLVASGDVIVDGFLSIDIDDISPGVPFVPVLGQTFNIITGNTVTGNFDVYDISGMPEGLTFHINYLSNAVQLEVVNKELFAADFDDDGDVDLTDYAIWKNAFNLNQLGDANGDNISDASDYTIWRDQLGSVSGGAGAGSLFAAGQAAVPEPSLCAILLGAAGVLTGLRGRFRR